MHHAKDKLRDLITSRASASPITCLGLTSVFICSLMNQVDIEPLALQEVLRQELAFKLAQDKS